MGSSGDNYHSHGEQYYENDDDDDDDDYLTAESSLSDTDENQPRDTYQHAHSDSDYELESSQTFNEKSIVHLFLPKKTPDKLEDDLPQTEKDILAQVTHSFQNVMKSSQLSQLAPVHVMLRKWVQIQPITSVVREDAVSFMCLELEDLHVGYTIPIYIREQNCAMMISKVLLEDKEQIRVQTFRASLPSSMIMSNVDPLQMNFPETSNLIQNVDMLCSRIFVSHLYEMATEEFPLSKGRIGKAGNSFVAKREVSHPFLVSDWAVGILVPREDPTSLTISKKIRDQVTMATCKSSSKLIPFRRSGMWMSIKVTLHLKLLEVFGGDTETAKLVYKIVILRILVDASKSYQNRNTCFDCDLASQMMAKVGRRVIKLERLSCGECDEMVSVQVERMKSIVLEYALKVVTALNETVQNQWNQVTSFRKKELPVNRSTEDFMDDVMHSIEPLDQILVKARKMFESPEPDTGRDIENIKAESINLMKNNAKCRFNTLKDINQFNNGKGDKSQLRIWLHDTEQFIKSIQDNYTFTSQQIFDLGLNYIVKARNEFKDNPLGFSQVLLVSLKLSYILDKIATQSHPLLLHYKPDINTSSFDCLLLPHDNDVRLLNELVDYFNERDKNGSWPILERKINRNSLSVSFAEQNEDMICLRQRIQEDIDIASQRKLEEVERIREECQSIESRMSNLGKTCLCQYGWKNMTIWNTQEMRYQIQTVGALVHICELCNLRRQLARKRNSVAVYEIPLPTKIHFQNAIVFELLIPEEISHFRQFLAMLKYELLGEKIFNGEGNAVSRHWMDYAAICRYASKPELFSNRGIITLGSTTMPSSNTHHHMNGNPDLLSNSSDAFIVNNAMNCHFYFRNKLKVVRNPLEACTFRLMDTANSDPYLFLQRYVGSTWHFQNDVLASQNDCHPKLSLNEYITFGSLRAGHRIQLRNLYMAISSRSLTLEWESVMALVLQTIWQVGPRGDGGVRESHLDFMEDDFALEFLELLETLVKSNESNYSIPLVLLTAILITGRIMELNKNCEDKCYQLFKDWRQLTKTWSSKIEDDLMDMDTSNAKSAVNKATMQKILHEIKLCSMMTFNISSHDQIKNVCRTSQDIAYLLHTICSKNILDKESNPSFSGFMEILRYTEELITVKMNLDEQIITTGTEGLSLFLKEKFPSIRDNGEYEIIKPCESIIMTQYSNEYCITLDVFTGEILVNGFPETELSSQISENLQFQRFFQNHQNFRVQRKSINVLRTSEPVRGKHYEFRTQNNDLEIIEILGNRSSLVLVPHYKFRGFISDHFIDNYTHWLDPRKESIYFRRIVEKGSDNDLPHEYVLMRNGGDDWMFHDEINQHLLLSINSDGFKLLTNSLSRMESAKHMSVFMNNLGNAVGAHLPRHNLRFILKPNGFLESLEYPGFHVSLDQDSTGTFVGFQNVLLMENGAKKNIIIPHGSISSVASGGFHQSCMIDTDSLSQPSFYTYEFDDVLKRIVGKKSISSWLYLAALHAATSSSQPDPFTGMTGTEMAVTILQSAIVWSCSPYDKESLDILKFIKGLSPRRSYYGHKINVHVDKKKKKREEIETIEWPEGIPTMVAYDGYAILVDALVRDSIRLEALHPILEDCNCKELYEELREDDFSVKLLLRAYLRNIDMYNDQVRLNEDLVNRLQLTFQENVCSLKSGAENAELSLTPLVTTAYMCHLGEESLPSVELEKQSLIPFLLTDELLICETDWNVDFSLANLLSLEFRPFWLKYYHLAISKPAIVDQHQFTILLSALAYNGAPLEQITILHCIRSLVDSGQVETDFFPSVPELPNVEDPTLSFYDESEIAEILQEYVLPVPMMYTEFQDFEMYARARKDYEARIPDECLDIARRWKLLWPCGEISENEIDILQDANIHEMAFTEVNAKIRYWHDAWVLKMFIDEVQEKLDECVDIISAKSVENGQLISPVLPVISSQVRCQRSEQKLIKISDLMNQSNKGYDLMSEAREIYQTGKFEIVQADQDPGWILRSRTECGMKIAKIENAISRSLLSTVQHRILYNCGLCPRLNPSNLLRTILTPKLKGNMVKVLAGALGVLWTHLKRLNRCLHFQLHGQQVELERELQNPGHQTWSPMERPEWLLLELELDIMIRPVQVEVAEQMRCMPDEKNGVMQLNMGEGKTSVIVPILCSLLAQEDILCRVTVLSSIFKMNWNILKFAIGGLLNRRLYTFPCRRDMKMDLECVEDILDIYKECMQMKGVVLTLPEYRLSFRSLAYDKILKEETELGLKLLETEDWLRCHTRDILDESDELLRGHA